MRIKRPNGGLLGMNGGADIMSRRLPMAAYFQMFMADVGGISSRCHGVRRGYQAPPTTFASGSKMVSPDWHLSTWQNRFIRSFWKPRNTCALGFQIGRAHL